MVTPSSREENLDYSFEITTVLSAIGWVDRILFLKLRLFFLY